LRELIKIFKENPDIDFGRDISTASILLPNGEREQAYDSGGVMRDILTEFWDDFYEQCTTGTNLKAPCLRHDMETADWKAVGRVIVLGWIPQKVLPIRLAPNFVNSSLYGMPNDSLREKFLQFIPGLFQMLLKTWKTSKWTNFSRSYQLMNAKLKLRKIILVPLLIKLHIWKWFKNQLSSGNAFLRC
jgi:hypothetical protein